MLIKIPTEFVLEVDEPSLNFIRKNKQVRMVGKNLKKK